VKTHVVYRLNMYGKKCVAPFINEWNVGDIPVKEWTPGVQPRYSALLTETRVVGR
jgi:hypothetical protein